MTLGWEPSANSAFSKIFSKYRDVYSNKNDDPLLFVFALQQKHYIFMYLGSLSLSGTGSFCYLWCEDTKPTYVLCMYKTPIFPRWTSSKRVPMSWASTVLAGSLLFSLQVGVFVVFLAGRGLCCSLCRYRSMLFFLQVGAFVVLSVGTGLCCSHCR